MRGYILDTHVWIWFVAGSPRLPPGLRRVIEDGPPSLWLSPISVWEVCMLAAKGRIELTLKPRQWVERALEEYSLMEAPINVEIALRSKELPLSHPDPADAFLAATTLVYDLTLLTVDSRLADLAWLPTMSA